MAHLWTLGSWQFVGIYAAVLGLTVLVRLALWRVIRQAPGRQIARDLDPYEVGYLIGGVRRVAEVVIAELVCSGALRVDLNGRLSEADRAARTGPYAGALDRMTPTGMPDGRKTRRIRRKLGADPEIVMIGRRLRREGLATPDRLVVILRLITRVLLLALLAIWILRVIGLGIHHGHALFVMYMLMIFTVPGVVITPFVAGDTNTTRTLGRTYLTEHTYLLPPEAIEPGRLPPGSLASTTAAIPATVLFDTARRGFYAVPDLSIRADLLRGLEIPGFSGEGGEGASG